MCILHDTVNSKLFWSELAFAGTPHNQERERVTVVLLLLFKGSLDFVISVQYL
jgi:hypothetical protein